MTTKFSSVAALLLATSIVGTLAAPVAAQDFPPLPEAIQEQGVIRIGVKCDSPPFGASGVDGTPMGIEVEMAKKIGEYAFGSEDGAELSCVTSEARIPSLNSGKLDLILATLGRFPAREEVIDFTQDYFPPAHSAYVALSGASKDVVKGVVAAQTSTVQAAHVAESGATLVEFATMDDTIAAVRNGEAGAVFADKGVLEDIVKESGGDLAFVGSDVVIGEGIGIGVRESDTALKDKFNDGITKMKADGSLNKLLVKYFGADSMTFKN